MGWGAPMGPGDPLQFTAGAPPQASGETPPGVKAGDAFYDGFHLVHLHGSDTAPSQGARTVKNLTLVLAATVGCS